MAKIYENTVPAKGQLKKNTFVTFEFPENGGLRILFGTDSENRRGPEKIKFVRQFLEGTGETFQRSAFEDLSVTTLNLSPQTVKKICYDNYVSFAGDYATPVNLPLLQEVKDQLLKDLKNEEQIQLLKAMV